MIPLVVLFYFLQIPTSKALMKIKKSIKVATDKRVNVMSQLIQGVRTIKMYGWEEPLIHKAREARQVECRRFCKQYVLRGVVDSFFKNAGMFLYIPIFLVKVFSGEILQQAAIFTAMNMMDILATTSIFKFNFAVNSSTEYQTVINRLQEILVLQEKQVEDQEHSGPRIHC